MDKEMDMRKAILLAVLIAGPAFGATAYKFYRLAPPTGEADTGAIGSTATGATASVRVHGGDAVVQVDCHEDAECVGLDEGPNSAVWDCCSGAGAGTCGTWPDSLVLEASVDNGADYEFAQVDGSTSYTADQREGVFFFAPGEYARINITDAAGSFECYASLSFKEKKQ